MRAVLAVALVLGIAGCDPFGLPSTRALENGAAAALTSASSLEMAGTYTAGGVTWAVDLQIARPNSEHVVVGNGADSVEAILIDHAAYFRGAKFLATHVTDPHSQQLIKAAGNSWWQGIAVDVPQLPDLTAGDAFRTAFLGPAVAARTDHTDVGGVDAVELSGSRADVYIASAPPYPLLRIHIKEGVTVDGITKADLVYSHLNADFGIAAPSSVIDFSNLSTLPPIYTVESVDTSQCSSNCVVSATVRNLGGAVGAASPSTVTFTMADAVSKKALGTCTATVQPDVGFNQTATVSCTISAAATNAAVVTATATNPGRG
jgi:hypothetical protein